MTFPYHLLVGCVVWLLWSASAVGAFEDETHRRINLRAAQAVTSINRLVPFDQFLTDSVGLVQGLNTPFRDVGGATNKDGKINSVLDWLALGGVTEDTPLCRPARHFHDPLQPWIGAGLRAVNPVINVRCGTSFPASALWGQSLTQTVGEQRSWFDARASFVNALTGSSQASRDQAWASTFQTLGQLMHLVADASVPEHVRNDTHITAGIFRKVGIPVGSYEWWVEKNLGALLTSTAPRFDPIILRQSTNNAEAPISIARLIDTDTYTGLGSGAGVTLSPAIGLAEFTNANFFSEDTGNRRQFERDYPFPALDLLAGSEHPAPVGTNIRRYYKKGSDGGIPVDPVLAECVFDIAAMDVGLEVPDTYNCVDENVWRATATEMVPRAVDYAAGLLEYFFRGRIEIAAPARFAYGLSAFQPGNAGVFTKLRFKVRNDTREEAGPGRMTAVVRYRTPITSESLIDNPFTEVAAAPSFAVSRPLDLVTLTASFQELIFDFTDTPIPANSTDLFLTVVYKARLGLEDGAVMVGGRDLFEPDPFDVGNATDWECAEGELYHVADLTAYPPYLPPGQIQRDPTRDGVQDLFGPAVAFNTYVKTFDLSQTLPTPSASSFDLFIEQQSFPEFTRVMVLQDQPTYGGAVLTAATQDVASGLVHSNVFEVGALQGVINDMVVGPGGVVVRRVLPSTVYRGTSIHHAMLLVTPPTAECLPQTSGLTPPLTRIDGGVPLQ
jgi:hypothetical protein